MLASGAIMSATGFFDSFILMVFLRVLLGLVSSAFNPLSFSILAEIFP
jgi:MFS family permease